MIASPKSVGQILLVDDDELICRSLRHYLVTRGYRVDVAADAAAADALMLASSYSVIVVDPYLTAGVHRDNAELLERVCELQSGATIIVVTSYDSPALQQIAAKCGVVALLSKPQSVVSLERHIRAAMPPHAAPSTSEQNVVSTHPSAWKDRQ